MTAFIALGAGEAAGAAEAGAEAGAAEAGSEGIPSGAFDIGNGHKMMFSDEQFHALLHSEMVVEAIKARADGVTAECNATRRKKGAKYETLIQNRPETTRARAFTRPANADAHYDDARHSTMLKAAANAPNDPKPGGKRNKGADAGAADAPGDDDNSPGTTVVTS